MPFMALETRNSIRGNRLRMTADEALEVMFGLRGELEVRSEDVPMRHAYSHRTQHSLVIGLMHPTNACLHMYDCIDLCIFSLCAAIKDPGRPGPEAGAP